MATASIAITDVGMAFYDVPISFTFLAGTRYDLAFRGNLVSSWGSPTNPVPRSPGSSGGAVRVT